MKKTYLILFMILACFVFVPVRAKALTVSHSMMSDVPCTGSDSILGDPNDEESVAWLVHKILSYVTLGGMLLVVVLSSIDFFKVIIKNDTESFQKAAKKFGLRLIFAAFLFFVPAIANALLGIFGLTSTSTCGIQQ